MTSEFTCEICSLGFVSKSGYYLHIQSQHNNGKKYHCNDCGKQYTKKSDLISHINNIHKNIKHKCDKCDREYSSRELCTITSSLLMKTRNISVHYVIIKLQRWAILHDINIQSMKV